MKTCFFGLLLCIFINLNSENLVFFSPDDKVSDKLIEYINTAQKRIYVAIYMLTDKRISKALSSAKINRFVDVQVVTDISCLESEYGKIDFLKKQGIDIFIFKPNLKNKKYFNPIMHNKFALLDNKVWTGSFNWTISANTKNYENVICLDDESVCIQYEKQFEKLKKKCFKHSIPKAQTTKIKANTDKYQKSYLSLKEKTILLLKSIRKQFQ